MPDRADALQSGWRARSHHVPGNHQRRPQASSFASENSPRSAECWVLNAQSALEIAARRLRFRNPGGNAKKRRRSRRDARMKGSYVRNPQCMRHQLTASQGCEIDTPALITAAGVKHPPLYPALSPSATNTQHSTPEHAPHPYPSTLPRNPGPVPVRFPSFTPFAFKSVPVLVEDPTVLRIPELSERGTAPMMDEYVLSADYPVARTVYPHRVVIVLEHTHAKLFVERPDLVKRRLPHPEAEHRQDANIERPCICSRV